MAPPTHPATIPRRIGFLDMDAYFVNVERLLNPALVGQPVIVGGPADSRGVVAAASYETRALGVRSAMPMRTALRLAPNAVVVFPSRGAYSRYSREVRTMLESMAPVVRQASIDEFYFDLTGCERLYGGRLITALERMRAATAAMGLPSTAALASGPLVAKIAVETVKPNGILEILPGEERAFLAPLAVEKMPGVGPTTLATLRKLRLVTLGDVQKAGPEALEKSLGAWGRALYANACAEGSGELGESGPAKSYSRETTFATDSRDAEWMLAQLSALVEDVAASLRHDLRLARTATVKLRYADFTTHTWSKTVKPGDDEAVWWGLARELFETRRDPRQAVRLIGFRLSGISDTGGQMGLFEAPTDKRRKRLDQAVDQARAKFGDGSLVRGRSMEKPE